MSQADARSAAGALDALVVGAGPVGLTMAAELTRHGLRCRIVERNAARTDKSKALVLWPRTLELLDLSAAVEPFLAAGLRVRGARLFGDGAPLAELTFDDLASAHPFALMIPQSETERLLEAHLNGLGVEVERCVELVGFDPAADVVTARLRRADGSEDTVQAAWLIGCDGAHSAVRHGLGMDFTGSAEPNDWILADVRITGNVPTDELRIDWNAEGILVFFPIQPGRFRVIADCGTAAPSERPHDPTLPEVQAVVDARGPGRLMLHDPVWLAGFRINERKVKDYRHGRVFLAGDAAHIHSPAGGQGMNTGMHDAYNLAWKLGLKHAGHASEPLLDSYSTERSAIGDLVLRNAAAMTRVATVRNERAQHLRNAVLPMALMVGAVRGAMRDTLSELGVNYRGGPLSCDDRSLAGRARSRLTGSIAAGDRAPDVPLVDAITGVETRLFALLRPGRHCLLLCTDDESEAHSAEVADLFAAVQRACPGLVDVYVVAPSGTPRTLALLLDRTGAVRSTYSVDAPTAVLIRPDGYIGFLGQPLHRDRLLSHLAQYLI